jgi:hypothetical protein
LTGALGARKNFGPTARRRSRRAAGVISLLLLVGGYPAAVRAENVASLSALKAAYTLHFLNLIRWERPEKSLDFCVFGVSETGERMLVTLHDKTVHGQSIRARRVLRDAAERQPCDALYIPESYASFTPALLKHYETSATVTISDSAGFVNAGGVIGFVIVDDRLRFDVNERAAGKKHLKISAKLLELARSIVR